MELYTVSMSQWRLVKERGIEFLDTTVKSNPGPFSPTWEMVLMVKNKEISQELYTELYYDMMRSSYRNNTTYWLHWLNKPTLAIACYCRAGKFCHRHLLKDMMQKVCDHHHIPFNYLGEITPGGILHDGYQ